MKEDDKTFYSHKRVRIGEKRIETPLKTISPLGKQIQIDITNRIIEVYMKFNKDALARLTSQINQQEGFNRKLKRIIGICSPVLHDTPFVLIPELKYLYPSEIELNFLINTQAIFDLYTIPTAWIKDIDDLQKYIEVVKTCLNLIEEMKMKKPLVGTIPMNLPAGKLEELLNNYLDYEIAALVMDFRGRVPFSVYQNVFHIQNLIRRKETNVLIYGINVNIGKPSKNAEAILAKDVLSIGLGLDILGDNHVVRGWSREMGTLRIFIKEEYSYRRISPSKIDELYPKDTKVSKEYLISGSRKERMNAQRAFNYEQIGLETTRIRNKIDSGEIVEYISQKEYVKKDSRLLEKLLGAKKVEDLSSFI
ncbi:MAG: hypothetical protein ACP5I2_07835 [Fervidicoccaceae archaeon]